LMQREVINTNTLFLNAKAHMLIAACTLHVLLYSVFTFSADL